MVKQFAQPSRLNAHDSVCGRIIVGVLAEYVDSNGKTFQPVGLAGQLLVY